MQHFTSPPPPAPPPAPTNNPASVYLSVRPPHHFLCSLSARGRSVQQNFLPALIPLSLSSPALVSFELSFLSPLTPQLHSLETRLNGRCCARSVRSLWVWEERERENFVGVNLTATAVVVAVFTLPHFCFCRGQKPLDRSRSFALSSRSRTQSCGPQQQLSTVVAAVAVAGIPKT